ncbi:hypothetical protein GCM10022263_39150 [Nocardioides daeguensis]|uniref:Uncharacterized protein n=2 Tax=Nocardioides daeguensis TaxID=908359 RepID=A0ABP6W9V9_9ACTN
MAALVAVVVANAGALVWLCAPPSLVPYLGFEVDVYGPIVVFTALLVLVAGGWATGLLPRRSPYVLAAGAILLGDLVLAVLAALAFIWIMNGVATL